LKHEVCERDAPGANILQLDIFLYRVGGQPDRNNTHGRLATFPSDVSIHGEVTAGGVQVQMGLDGLAGAGSGKSAPAQSCDRLVMLVLPKRLPYRVTPRV
jgi:hypothetical protein